MMSSFTFYVVLKTLVIQECFCELQKGQTKTISLCSWTTFAFWICRKVHSPGSTIFEQNIHYLFARLNCAAEAFQAVLCKNPLPTLNSISVDQSLFQSVFVAFSGQLLQHLSVGSTYIFRFLSEDFYFNCIVTGLLRTSVVYEKFTVSIQVSCTYKTALQVFVLIPVMLRLI